MIDIGKKIIVPFIANEIGKALISKMFKVPFEEVCDELIDQVEMDLEGIGFNADGFNAEVFYERKDW